MQIVKTAEYIPDPGRRLSDEERTYVPESARRAIVAQASPFGADACWTAKRKGCIGGGYSYASSGIRPRIQEGRAGGPTLSNIAGFMAREPRRWVYTASAIASSNCEL